MSPKELAAVKRDIEASLCGSHPRVDKVVDYHGRTLWERPQKPSLWARLLARLRPHQNPFVEKP